MLGVKIGNPIEGATNRILRVHTSPWLVEQYHSYKNINFVRPMKVAAAARMTTTTLPFGP
jgi:hypothetical protein